MATTKEVTVAVPKIVMVTMINRLGSVKGLNGPIRPEMYRVKTRDENEEGTPMGEYRDPAFMNTKIGLSPSWDNILQEWQFAGTYNDFTRLVKGMNLRYPTGHPNAGGRIKVESLEAHKRNRMDPVFQNEEVISAFFLVNGKGTLRTENPLHEFLYHSFRACRKFNDETTDEKPKNHANAKYRMSATKKENTHRRADVDKRMKAMGLISQISNDENRLRAICLLTKIPGYSSQSDVNGMVILLDEQVNNSPDRPISQHNGRPFIDVLQDYLTMETSALKYEYDIMRAYQQGIIRPATGGINLQGTFHVGPTNFEQTVKFFRDPRNQDYFFELTTTLGK